MISIGRPKRLRDGRADCELRWAKVGRKKFFILRQTGTFADISYDHGRLLAAEIEDGVFPEIIDTIRTGTDMESDTMDWLISAVYRRLSDDVFDACSEEFRAATKALGDGMFDGLETPGFTPQDVRDALVAIDVGNLAEGLTRRMEKPLAPEVSETFVYVLGAARRYRRTSRRRVKDDFGDKTAVGAGLQRMNDPGRRVGFGCTAMGAAPALTADGLALHARTFDGAFFAWNRYPGLFIVDERQTNPALHRYIGVGTAGLTYPGGISGMNEAGLAASIHQMSTVNYDTGRPGRGYAVAPFLQQRILREAGSLDESEQILRSARHFASWTIVVTDAKAGASARFEINGGTQRVARMDLGERFSQSNHFMAEGMAEKNRFFDDAHFTPSFGKWLESRARIETVEGAFGESKPDSDWAIHLLGGHDDGAIGGKPRSFGRTICKAYGLMGSIARMDPERARARDEIWFSIGDDSPGPHASFAGFSIDWDKMILSPVSDRPVRKAKTVSRETLTSLGDYVEAFETLARPRDRNGYLGRDPTPGEERALTRKAADLVGRAADRVEDAGEMDFAFRYARARLSLACGRHARARRDCAFLRKYAELQPDAVLDHERMMVLVISAAAEFERRANAAGYGFLDEAEKMLAKVRKSHFPGRRRPHQGLLDWQKMIKDLRENGADAELKAFDFVTVE